MVLDMLADTILAINDGDPADPTVIAHLSKALDAHAAISVYVDSSGSFDLVAAHPSLDEAQPLTDYLLDIGPSTIKHHVMIDHCKGVGHVCFVYIPPDDEIAPEGGFERIMAFARDVPYDEEAAVILERACRPLTALWPQAARAYSQRRAANADYSITAREREVLELLSRGMLATSIASRLNLSPRTVHKHLGNIYRKLGVHDRLVAVGIAQSSGLLDSGGSTKRRMPASA
jgi:DNA-binding CsgD family transcriptional regulator